MSGATAANAVADFRGTGFHHALAPCADECRQSARGVDHLFHDWGVGQMDERFCSVVEERDTGLSGQDVAAGFLRADATDEASFDQWAQEVERALL